MSVQSNTRRTAERLLTPEIKLVAVALVALAALPVFGPSIGIDEYYIGLVRRIMIFVIAGIGLNFVLGHCGMIAIGYAGFMGVGAYTLAALVDAGVSSAWVLWIAATIVSGIVGATIGIIALRAKGIYFIMITLAFAQMLYYLAVSYQRLGGDDGYSLPFRPNLGFGYTTRSEWVLYWIVLALVVMIFVFTSRVMASRFGQAMIGIRENESRMEALGFPVFWLQLVAFAGTAAIAGLSGALLGSNNGYISPSMMSATQSLILLVMVVIGGLGRLWGGVLGVVIWMVLHELIQHSTEYWRWPIGLMLVLIVFFVPQGFAALLARIPGLQRPS